jgi:transposase InsO family protein
LDIVGPLRKAPRGYTYLLVAIDKFSKWVEVRTITNLKAKEAVTFFTDIIYRFGVPNSIITDNGSQFTGRKFLSSVTSSTSASIGRLWHIPRPTVKWSAPTA